MNDIIDSKPPTSFYWIAGLALVWNLLGLFAYVAQVTMGPEALAAMSDAERALYENMPAWATSAFAIAVTAGVLGCLLLILRKSLALPMLVLSLVGVVVQMIYNFLMSNALEVMGGKAAIGPIVILIVGIFLIWYANSAKRKGWLS